MKVIKSLFRVISLIAMCYTIYLLCFNAVFNAMVASWIALYFWLVSKDEQTKREIEEELLGKIRLVISLQKFDESGEYRRAIEDTEECIATVEEVNKKVALIKY